MNIQAAIADLYTETSVAYPSKHRPLVRLNEFIQALNLTCEEVAGLTRDVASRKLAERGGVIDEDGGERQSPLAAFLYAVANDGTIFVEERDPVTQRRFSVAHELGHYILHFRPLLTHLSARFGTPAEALDALPSAVPHSAPDAIRTGQIVLPHAYAESETLPPLPQMEAEATRFAAELLMPEPLLRELTTHYHPFFADNDLLWRMASDLLVSPTAIRWRLRSLGIIE